MIINEYRGVGTTDNNIFVVVVIVVDIVVVVIRNVETKQVSIVFGPDRLTGGDDGTELRYSSAVQREPCEFNRADTDIARQ